MKETINDKLCRATAARTDYTDIKVPGFTLRTTPTGHCSFWFFKWHQGRQLKIKIGDWPAFNTATARDEARQIAAKLARGQDVVTENREAKAADARGYQTFAAVVGEYITWAKQEVINTDGDARPRIKNWRIREGQLNRHVLPTLGKQPIKELSHNPNAFSKLLDTKTHAVQCNLRIILSAVFKWASRGERDYCEVNPIGRLDSVEKYPTREVVLSDDEVRTLWHGLDDPRVPCARSVALAIKFILVTGLRPGEVAGIRYDEIKNVGTLTYVEIPAIRVKKNRAGKKAHRIACPLNSLALEIVAQARKLDDGSGALFPAGRKNGLGGRGPKVNVGPVVREALCRAITGKGNHSKDNISDWLGIKTPFRAHDLRRTFATICGRARIDETVIARLLDHEVAGVPDVTEVYNRFDYLAPKAAALDAFDAALRGIIGNPPPYLRLAVG